MLHNKLSTFISNEWVRFFLSILIGVIIVLSIILALMLMKENEISFVYANF